MGSPGFVLSEGDLEHDFYWHALESGDVAWDIETSGLDWSSDQIGTCQLATRERVAVVRLGPVQSPKRLTSILEAANVRKHFHHAPFDLRFMAFAWDATPRNVACTKIASKILDPDRPSAEHSLRPVLARHLGVEISKAEQRSDWLTGSLTDAQIQYAVTDVLHLLDLSATLQEKCRKEGLSELLANSWGYIATRVQLDLRGSGDVFAY